MNAELPWRSKTLQQANGHVKNSELVEMGQIGGCRNKLKPKGGKGRT